MTTVPNSQGYEELTEEQIEGSQGRKITITELINQVAEVIAETPMTEKQRNIITHGFKSCLEVISKLEKKIEEGKPNEQ